MKKGQFIYNVNEPALDKERANPWKKGMIYNHRELELDTRGGITSMLKTFSVAGGKKAVKKATVRATALGVFELFFNGKRVGSYENGVKVYDELKPGWTDYRFRVFEFEYDLSADVKNENTFVAMVSTGWWSGRLSFGFYGLEKTAFCAEIEIEYKDGTSELIATDESWKTTVGGPILTADIWDGEYYDARIPHPAVCPEAHSWINAQIFTGFCDGQAPVIVPTEDKIREKTAITRTPISAVVHNGTVKNGSTFGKIKILSKAVGEGCEKIVLKKGKKIILDMGQDMVGRPEITVRAVKGTKITGMVAEFLNDSGDEARANDGPEGSMYVMNYRSAIARFVYVTEGKKSETYSPTHTFYGFRYIELSADANVTILGVKGLVIGSDMDETAFFECDNPEVNQLWSNIVWGMRGNYLSVPTDCPQRDERLGWTGDTQIFCGAGSYLANVKKFLSKWLCDLSDSQKGYDGGVCDVVPRVFTKRHTSNAAWADAALIVPYRLWLMYNDTDIIARQYQSMEDYMENLSQYGLEGPNTAYGDWLNYDVTDKRYIAVCYYKYDADLMAHFSALLGKSDREAYYKDLSARIKEYFLATYFENGSLTMTTQTCCLLALAFDMLPKESVEGVIATLRRKIEDNNYTLSTGFVGTGILNQTLAKFGLNDLAYSLFLQTADPSWLYSVRQGATTIWERWNSYTKETGFGNVGMNSFNHYAYGAVAEWVMSSMIGIRPDENAPGFKKFILAPEPDTREFIPEGQRRIRRAKAHYDTEYGRIESAWEYVGEKIAYSFTIPAETTATVILALDGKEIQINDVKFKATELGTVENGKVTFVLGAGKYSII